MWGRPRRLASGLQASLLLFSLLALPCIGKSLVHTRVRMLLSVCSSSKQPPVGYPSGQGLLTLMARSALRRAHPGKRPVQTLKVDVGLGGQGILEP